MGYVFRARGPEVGVPVEAFHLLVCLWQLHDGVGVVLGRLEVVYLVYGSLLEPGGEDLGLHFVYGGQHAVLFQIEEGCGASQGIEPQDGVGGGVEVCHYLGAFYLVVADFVVLGDYEGVALQACLARAASAHKDEEAV